MDKKRRAVLPLEDGNRIVLYLAKDDTEDDARAMLKDTLSLSENIGVKPLWNQFRIEEVG